MRAALVRQSDGYVANIIEYDPESTYQPPSGHTIVGDPTGVAQVSGGWTGSVFTPHVPTPEEIAVSLAQDNRSAIEQNLADTDQPAQQAIIDTVNPTLAGTTIAALRNEVQTILRDMARADKDQARNLRRLNRHALGTFEATD